MSPFQIFGSPNIDKLKTKKDIPSLIKALTYKTNSTKTNDIQIRCLAAGALGEIKDARAVEPLIAALKDSDEEVRKATAEALGQIGSPAVEPLITALKDSNADVRMGAAWALGLINDARAVKPLITALKDSDADVRMGAADALGLIKDVRAVKPLITALHDKYKDVRQAAERSLGEIGSPAVELLITALKKSNADVRMGAAYALGEIKDVRAVEPLITALKDSHEDVRREAEMALANIGGLTADQAAEVQQARVPQDEAKMGVSMKPEEKIYSGPFMSDLTQEGLIRELQKMGMTREEADVSVEVALVLTSTLDRSQINAIYSSDQLLTADNLALKWAAHQVYHGASIQKR